MGRHRERSLERRIRRRQRQQIETRLQQRTPSRFVFHGTATQQQTEGGGVRDIVQQSATRLSPVFFGYDDAENVSKQMVAIVRVRVLGLNEMSFTARRQRIFCNVVAALLKIGAVNSRTELRAHGGFGKLVHGCGSTDQAAANCTALGAVTIGGFKVISGAALGKVRREVATAAATVELSADGGACRRGVKFNCAGKCASDSARGGVLDVRVRLHVSRLSNLFIPRTFRGIARTQQCRAAKARHRTPNGQAADLSFGLHALETETLTEMMQQLRRLSASGVLAATLTGARFSRRRFGLAVLYMDGHVCRMSAEARKLAQASLWEQGALHLSLRECRPGRSPPPHPTACSRRIDRAGVVEADNYADTARPRYLCDGSRVEGSAAVPPESASLTAWRTVHAYWTQLCRSRHPSCADSVFVRDRHASHRSHPVFHSKVREELRTAALACIVYNIYIYININMYSLLGCTGIGCRREQSHQRCLSLRTVLFCVARLNAPHLCRQKCSSAALIGCRSTAPVGFVRTRLLGPTRVLERPLLRHRRQRRKTTPPMAQIVPLPRRVGTGKVVHRGILQPLRIPPVPSFARRI